MMRQNLPIYARTRTASGISRRQAALPILSDLDSQAVLPVPILSEQPYACSTLAGRADTVWHSSSFGARKPLPVPVWRSGYRDGRAQQALFNKPTGLAVDRRGHVYVSDSLNHCIRRISPRGRVETLIGNGQRGFVDGSVRRARLNHPTGLALDANQALYIVDQGNRALRCYTPEGHLLTLELPGTPTGGITVVDNALYLFLEVGAGHPSVTVLARVQPDSGETALLADWEGRLQWLNYRAGAEEQPFSRWWRERQHRPRAITIADPLYAEGLGLTRDDRGHLFWVSGYFLYRLEQTPDLVLHRQALKTEFWPGLRWQGLAVGASGTVYALDARHHRLFCIQEDGHLTQVAEPQALNLAQPYAIVRDAYGRLYVSDTGHWRVCRLIPPGQESLLQLARQAFLPYLPVVEPVAPRPTRSNRAARGLKKGFWKHMQKYLARWRSDDEDSPQPEVPMPLASQHLMDVLVQGNRSQQLACVKEVVDLLGQPHQKQPPLAWRPLFERLLAHPETAVRSLLIRHLCDLIHHEHEALFWLELLEQHREPNRLLKKYLIEVLAFLGKRYELYGHVVPLMVEYIRVDEEDVVEYVFQHLLKIRTAGYESLVDPLIEELGAR